MCQTCGSNPCLSGCVSLKGDQGVAGSKWYNGAGAPAPNLGVTGDYYINTTNDDLYYKTDSTTWGVIGNIKGATGTTGGSGAVMSYNSWAAVTYSAAPNTFADLITSGNITLDSNGDQLRIEAGFIVSPVISPLNFITTILTYNNVDIISPNAFYGISAGAAKICILNAEITRIDNTHIRFVTSFQNFDQNAIALPSIWQKYYTNSNQAIASLSVGGTVKARGRTTSGSGIVNDYLNVIKVRV